MTPKDFDFIASLLKKHSGFSLMPSQLYLLESRLAPILRQNNLTTLEDLITSLKLNDVELRKSVIEAVSVNNTRFFRNKYVFETIRNFLLQKNMKKEQMDRLKVLSAGCASGQEPVSVALLLNEMDLHDIDVYALDMSRQMIARAQKAIYTHYEVQKGLPVAMLLKYFDPQEDGSWRLNANMLSKIHYRIHNLMTLFDEKNFDIILCRNMLSFMTDEAQMTALKNLSEIINPNGMLIIGASEVLRPNPYFEKDADKIACYHLTTSDTKQKKGWNLSLSGLIKR